MFMRGEFAKCCHVLCAVGWVLLAPVAQGDVEPSMDIPFSLPRETGAIGSSFLETVQKYNTVGADGDLRISIPLFEVPGKIPVPLDLTYKSGIKLDQEASWVGLGWNLAGWSVKRVTIHGDDVQSFTYYDKANQSRFFINDMYQVDIPGRSIKFFNKGTVEHPQFVPMAHSRDSLYVHASESRVRVCDSTCIPWYVEAPDVWGRIDQLCQCYPNLGDTADFWWDPKWEYTEYEHFVLVDENATRYVFKMPLRRSTIPGPVADYYRQGGAVNTCEWHSRDRAINSEWMLTAILSHDYVDGGGDPLNPLDTDYPRTDNKGTWVAFVYAGFDDCLENTKRSRKMGVWTRSSEIVQDRDTTEITYLRKVLTPNVVVDFKLRPMAHEFRNIRFWRSGHGDEQDTSRVKDLLLVQMQVFEYSGYLTRPVDVYPDPLPPDHFELGVRGQALYAVTFNYDFPDSTLLKTQWHRHFCGGDFDPNDRNDRDGEPTLRSITIGTDNRLQGTTIEDWPRHASEHVPFGSKKRYAFEYDTSLEDPLGVLKTLCEDAPPRRHRYDFYSNWIMGKDCDYEQRLNDSVAPWAADSLESQSWLESVTELIPQAWDQRDFFGYHYQYPEAWSLTKMTIPEGMTFEYTYEPDEFTIRNSHWSSGGCRVRNIGINRYSGITEWVHSIPYRRFFQDYPYKDVERSDSIVFSYGNNDDGIGYVTSMPTNYELFRTRYCQASMLPWISLASGWYLRFLGDNVDHTIQYPRIVWHLPEDRGSIEHYYLTTDTVPSDSRVTMLFREDSTQFIWDRHGKDMSYFNAFWLDRSPLHGIPYRTVMRGANGEETYSHETVFEWPVVDVSLMPFDDGFDDCRFCFLSGPSRFDCDTTAISYHVRPIREVVRDHGVQHMTTYEYEGGPLARLHSQTMELNGREVVRTFEYAATGIQGQTTAFDDRHYLKLMTAVTEEEGAGVKRREQLLEYRSDFLSQNRSGEQAFFYLSRSRDWLDVGSAPNQYLSNSVLDVDSSGNAVLTCDQRGVVTTSIHGRRGLEASCKGPNAEFFSHWSEYPETLPAVPQSGMTRDLYAGPEATVVNHTGPTLTGQRSCLIPASSSTPVIGIGAHWIEGDVPEGLCIAECWAFPSDQSAQAQLAISTPGANASCVSVWSGDWVHMVCSLTVSGSTPLTVETSATGGDVYLDDFRVYLDGCLVTTETYDPLGRKITASDANNIPARTFYNQYGEPWVVADEQYRPVDGQEFFFRSTDATALTLNLPFYHPEDGNRYRSDAPNAVYRIKTRGQGLVDDFSVSRLHRYEVDDSLILQYGRLWFYGDKENLEKEAHLRIPVEPFRNGIMFFDLLDSMTVHLCDEYYPTNCPVEEAATLWYGFEAENGHGYFFCLTETGVFRIYKYLSQDYGVRTLLYDQVLGQNFVHYYGRHEKGKVRFGLGRFDSSLYFFMNNNCVFRYTDSSFAGEDFSYLRFKFNNSASAHCKQKTSFDNLVFYPDPIITTEFIDCYGFVKQTQVLDSGRIHVQGSTHTLDYFQQAAFKPITVDISGSYGPFAMINDQIGPFNFINDYLGSDSMFYWEPGKPLDSGSYVHAYYADSLHTADTESDGVQRPYAEYVYSGEPEASLSSVRYPGVFSAHPSSYERRAAASQIAGYEGDAFAADSVFEEIAVDENGQSKQVYRDKEGRILAEAEPSPLWSEYFCDGQAMLEFCRVECHGSLDNGPYFSSETIVLPGTLEPAEQAATLHVDFYDDYGCCADVACRVLVNGEPVDSCNNQWCSGGGSFCVKSVSVRVGDVVRIEATYPESRGPAGFIDASLQYTVCDQPSIDTASVVTLHYPDYGGQDTLIVQPEGQRIRRSYANQSWLLSETTPDAGQSHYFYDQAGNCRFSVSESDLYFQTNEYWTRFRYFKYDGLGRVIEEGVVFNHPSWANWINAFDPDWPDPAEIDTSEFLVTARYEYDSGEFGRGRLARATRYYSGHSDSASWEEFDYDHRGRVTEKRIHVTGIDDSAGVAVYNTYNVEYDNLGNETRITYSNGKYVKYEYDRTGRLAALDDDEGLVHAEFEYWPNGKMKTKRLGLPTAQTVSYRYNARDWPTDINELTDVHFTDTGTAPHYAVHLDYKDGGFEGFPGGPSYSGGYFNGNVARYTLAVSPGLLGDRVTQTFAYDPLDRLAVEVSQLSGDPADTSTFAYDLNGNIVSVAHGDISSPDSTWQYFYYGGTNRVRCLTAESLPTDDILYTPSGSMEYYTADAMSMRYNHYEQLSHREMDGDVERDSVDYWYNTANQRIAKRCSYTFMGWCPPDSVAEDPDPFGLDGLMMLSGGGIPEMRPCPMEGTTWTGFNYLGDNLLMDYHGPYDGQLIGNYVYANGERIARFGNPEQPSKVQYYLTDHLGSVVGAVQLDGHLVQHNFYRPWGEKLDASIAFGEPNQFQYTGQYLDDDLDIDWYYYGSRYYDPYLKVFTSVDPRWSESPGWGSYVYCRNNPVKYVDPDGEYVETGLDILSIGLSAADFYNDPSWENAGWLALDVVCAALPLVPAVGIVRHAGKLDDAAKLAGKAVGKGDDVADAAKAADAAEGAAKHPGRLGGQAHREGVDKVVEKAGAEHPSSKVAREGRVDTPGGEKSMRFGDVTVYRNGQPVKVYQVGDVLKDGVTPVSRERKAISDIMRQGVDVEFIPKQ